jgi:hypothetical protein
MKPVFPAIILQECYELSSSKMRIVCVLIIFSPSSSVRLQPVRIRSWPLKNAGNLLTGASHGNE